MAARKTAQKKISKLDAQIGAEELRILLAEAGETIEVLLSARSGVNPSPAAFDRAEKFLERIKEALES